MRILLAAIAIALLTVTAHAQRTANWPQQRKETHKTADKGKKKADEKAYKDALKKIPNSNEPDDPWKGLR
jgi:hypothetical protein